MSNVMLILPLTFFRHYLCILVKKGRQIRLLDPLTLCKHATHSLKSPATATVRIRGRFAVFATTVSAVAALDWLTGEERVLLTHEDEPASFVVSACGTMLIQTHVSMGKEVTTLRRLIVS